jgi:hypothetical protein
MSINNLAIGYRTTGVQPLFLSCITNRCQFCQTYTDVKLPKALILFDFQSFDFERYLLKVIPGTRRVH